MINYKFPKIDRTLVCGILNITPDSFSDGGLWDEPQKALEQAIRMQQQGADVIDVGAQSTRPGAAHLTAQQEWERLEPVLNLLKDKITVPISIDTFFPECAEKSLLNGASIINDVSGKVSDEMCEVVKKYGAGWIIMHNPADADTVPEYKNGVVEDVKEFFERAVEKTDSYGIPRQSICLDIGIGFAKSYEDNLILLHEQEKTKVESTILMSAASRKRVIGIASGEENPAKRDSGTVAAHVISIMNGADIIRVHDVFSAVQSARVADAIKRSV